MTSMNQLICCFAKFCHHNVDWECVDTSLGLKTMWKKERKHCAALLIVKLAYKGENG